MPEALKQPTLTPEEQAIADRVKAEGLMVEPEPTGEPAAPAAAPPPPPPSSSDATPPAAPPSLTEAELKDLKDKAGWAVRSQQAASEEKARADALAADNERLRRALGVPAPAVSTPPTQVELEGLQWLERQQPTLFQKLPEEALATHPAIVKRDRALHHVNERLEQTLFLMRFPTADQEAVQQTVIPILAQQREAGGWKKSYAELWGTYKEAMRTQARIVGLAVPPSEPAPPATPPAPAPLPPVQVPPSLAGVSGGSVEVPKQEPSLTPYEASFYGLR